MNLWLLLFKSHSYLCMRYETLGHHFAADHVILPLFNICKVVTCCLYLSNVGPLSQLPNLKALTYHAKL